MEEGELVQIKQADGSEFTLKKHLHRGVAFFLFSVFAAPRRVFEHLENYRPSQGDVWLLTYPKAGTNWSYEITGILLSGELKPLPNTKVKTFLEFYPEVLSNRCPQVLNTHMHDKYLPSCIFQETKVIVVVRNPKSIVKSSYHFCLDRKAMNYSGSFHGFLPTFQEVGAFGEYCGTWYDYYFSLWQKYKAHPNVLFVFYEELKKDPVPVIKKMGDFLGVERDLEFCEGVAELASFEAMKQRVGNIEELGMTIQRRGKVDDWKNSFTVAQDEEFHKEYKEKMKNQPDLAKRIQFM